MPKQIVSHTPSHFDRQGQPWRNCWAESGRMYPQSMMKEYRGHWYCVDHFRAKIERERMDMRVEIEEEIVDGGASGTDFVAEVPSTYGNTDRS